MMEGSKALLQDLKSMIEENIWPLGSSINSPEIRFARADREGYEDAQPLLGESLHLQEIAGIV
jgi:hypothetical protein